MSARVRKNSPGQVRFVWVCPNGDILKIPSGKTPQTAVPDALQAVTGPRGGGRKGFFVGAVINDRLYVERLHQHEPTAKQLRAMRKFAQSERLSRGVIVEPVPRL